MSRFSIDWSELSLQVMITFGHFLWQACVVGIVLCIADRFLIFVSSVRIRGRDSLVVPPSGGSGVTCREEFRLKAGLQTQTDGSLHSANIRYTIACLAFFSLPICVAATFAWVHQSRGPILLTKKDPAESVTHPAVFVIEPTAVAPKDAIADVPALPPMAKAAEHVKAVVQPEAPSRVSNALPWMEELQTVAPYLLIAYSIGVGFMLARFGLSIVGSSRLRRTLQPITDSSLVKIIAEQSSRLGLKRIPVVALCQRVSVPVVVGIVKPMILVPPALLCGLDPHQLAAILSHEMAHIRRCDMIINLVQRIVEALLFFHPVTWWISRRISIERENCCDDLAAAGCGRLTYAGALLRMAELCAGIRGLKIAPQLESLAVDGGSTSQLGYRIKRLLGEDHSPRISLTRGAFATIALAAVFGGLSMVAVAQSGGSDPMEGQPTESTKRAENSDTQLIPSTRTIFGDEPREPADARKSPQRARNDQSSWIPVTGTLKLGGKPQADETIMLDFDTLSWSYSRGGPRLTTTHRTTTDKDGNFSFDRVPPLGGMARSLRGHGAVYQCESGKNTHIEVGAGNAKTLTLSDNHDHHHDHHHDEVKQENQPDGKSQLPRLIVKTVDSDGKPLPDKGVLFYDRNSHRAGQKQKFERIDRRTNESGVADFGVIPNSFGCLQLSPSNKELAECYTLISTTMTKCTQANPPRANVQTEIKDGILIVTFTMTPHVDLEFNIVDDATDEIVFWSEMFYQDPTTNRWWQFGLVDGSKTQHNFIPISPQITRETIRISALGYETKVFRLPDELDRSKPIRRDVRLKPMPDVELKVLLHDGTPAEKAKLTFHYPNELGCLQDHEGLSDAQGIVTTKFPPSADIGIFRLEHTGGTAELSMKELLDAVKLNPGEVIQRSIPLRK